MASKCKPWRRSACAECARVKRKCGQELPQCQRCQNRQLQCVYPSRSDEDPTENSLAAGFDQIQLPWVEAVYPYASSSTISWGDTLDLEDLIAAEPPPYLESAEPRINQMSRQEMNFCISQFTEYPLLWLRSGSAPFIHPALYESDIPSSLQAAYSASAIYATITQKNSDMAWMVIESLSNKILEDFSAGSIASQGPLDILAQVQSLCILQIIRLFGPDIRQRHLAELAEPALISMTSYLASLTMSCHGTRPANASSWRVWVFSEAVRRTVIMSLMIRGVYSLVKQGYCTLAPAVSEWSFTAQKGLWTSQNPVEWHTALRSEKDYWIPGMQFNELLQDGAKQDLDEMGMLMAVTYCGRASVEEWLARG
jgi:hypothetical protein